MLANLAEALRVLLDQLYSHLYPAHPHFEQEIKPLALRKVFEAMQAAFFAVPDQRLHVADRGTRQLLQAIANPLRLATMGQTHLVPEHHWPSHFERTCKFAITVRPRRHW